jgi:thymidylate synthase ThyX
MTITAQVVADSVSQTGVRLTTIELVYPRFIHAEFMTHRMFSRNASSSRAIPVGKQLKMINTNPAEPIHWGENQKGMQARTELRGIRKWLVRQLWKQHRRTSVRTAWAMALLGAHKQIVNRITEPHNHIRVLVTSTSWANFFALRNHHDAMPEIQKLAQEIEWAMDFSKPTILNDGEWHLPFVTDQEKIQHHRELGKLVSVSIARCARISYKAHDNKPSMFGTDIILAAKLVDSKPLHASPAEHQATPDSKSASPSLWGNFQGWIQYRKTLYEEYIEDGQYNMNEASHGDPSIVVSANGIPKPSKAHTVITNAGSGATTRKLK